MAKLGDDTRRRLKDRLISIRLDTMFGEYQLIDYIVNGLTLKGVEQMTDEELIAEFESHNMVIGENVDDFRKEMDDKSPALKALLDEWSENSELLDEAKFQLSLDKALEEN